MCSRTPPSGELSSLPVTSPPAPSSPPASSPARLSSDSLFKAIYSVDKEWFLPNDFNMQTFPEAIDVVLLGPSSNNRWLITTWKDKQSFQRAQSILERALHLGSPIYTEFVIQSFAHRTPWTILKTWSVLLYAALATLVALLSNIDSIRHVASDWWRTPFATAYPKQRKLIIPAGMPAEVEFRLQNQTYGSNVITIAEPTSIEATDMVEQKSVAVQVLSPSWEAELSAHQRESYLVTILAPKACKFVLKPIGSVKGGSLRSQVPLRVDNGCEIEAWGAIDRNPTLSTNSLSDSASTIEVTFQHGMPPEKLDYQCDLDLPMHSQIDASKIPDARVAIGKDTATIRWSATTTPRIPQRFRITVSYPPSKEDIKTLLNPKFNVARQAY